MISQEQINKVIKGGDTLYNACIQNGFFMAPKNSPINSNKFMLELYNETVMLPKSNEVRNFNVLHPPTRDQLIEMIGEIIELHGNYDSEEIRKAWFRLLDYIRKFKPEKQWLMGIVNYLNPSHVIFQKGYKPPHALQENNRVQPMFENRNGFFDNLDDLTAKQLKKHGSISFMSKKEKLEFQLQRIQDRQEQLELHKLKKMEAIENVGNESTGLKFTVSSDDFKLLQMAKQQDLQRGNIPFGFGGQLNQQHLMTQHEQQHEQQVQEQQPSASSMQKGMDALMVNEASEFVLIDTEVNAQVEQAEPTIAEMLAARTPQRSGRAKRFSERLKSSSKRN